MKTLFLLWIIFLAAGIGLLAFGAFVFATNFLQADSEKATTNTTKLDTDGDGLTDAEEEEAQTNIRSADTDKDGLTDYQEIKDYQTNPLSKDTDQDGYNDKQEVDGGYNPLKSPV